MADALTPRQLEILAELPSAAETPASTMHLRPDDCHALWDDRLVSAITEDGRRRRTVAGDVLVATLAETRPPEGPDIDYAIKRAIHRAQDYAALPIEQTNDSVEARIRLTLALNGLSDIAPHITSREVAQADGGES